MLLEGTTSKHAGDHTVTMSVYTHAATGSVNPTGSSKTEIWPTTYSGRIFPGRTT